MLRLGSLVSAHVPLKISVADDEIEVLDELPGWVGSDTNAPEGEQGGHAIELGDQGVWRERQSMRLIMEKLQENELENSS